MFIATAWNIMQPRQQHEQPHMSMSNASTIMMTVTMELINVKIHRRDCGEGPRNGNTYDINCQDLMKTFISLWTLKFLTVSLPRKIYVNHIKN